MLKNFKSDYKNLLKFLKIMCLEKANLNYIIALKNKSSIGLNGVYIYQLPQTNAISEQKLREELNVLIRKLAKIIDIIFDPPKAENKFSGRCALILMQK